MSDQNNPTQVAAVYQQNEERETALRHLREQKAILDVFEKSSVKFKMSPEAVVKALGSPVQFDMDGVPMQAGRTLAEQLHILAASQPHTVAGTVAEQHDKGRSTVKAKSDLATPKDKALFIEEFGISAFEKLPLTRVEQIPDESLTWGQYKQLPTREKVRIVNERGEQWIGALHRRSQGQRRADELAGVPHGQKKR